MQDHYRISDSEYANLEKSGVSVLDLLQNLKDFDPDGHGEPLNKLSLMHYVDRNGNFNISTLSSKHKLIAKAVFNSLAMPEKFEILKYIEDMEDAEF